MTPVVSPKDAPAHTLPTHLDLPFEDQTVVHNFFDHYQASLLTSSVDLWWRRRRPEQQYAVASDSYIYWDITTPPTLGAKAPDWFLVPGVPRLLDGRIRNSYVMWQEQRVPTVVFEFISETPGGEWDRTPRTGKFWVYEQGIRTPHYAIWDPWEDRLDAYRLVQERYQNAQPNERGHFPMPELGLEYGLWFGTWNQMERWWLRFWDADGHLLLTPDEQAAEEGRRAALAQEQARQAQHQAEKAQQQAEQARQQADQARQQAEQAHQQAEQAQRQAQDAQQQAQRAEQEKRKLADKLRELGIDPDQLP